MGGRYVRHPCTLVSRWIYIRPLESLIAPSKNTGDVLQLSRQETPSSYRSMRIMCYNVVFVDDDDDGGGGGGDSGDGDDGDGGDGDGEDM